MISSKETPIPLHPIHHFLCLLSYISIFYKGKKNPNIYNHTLNQITPRNQRKKLKNYGKKKSHESVKRLPTDSSRHGNS